MDDRWHRERLATLALRPMSDEPDDTWTFVARLLLVPTFRPAAALSVRSSGARAEVELISTPDSASGELVIACAAIDPEYPAQLRARLTRPVDETDPYARDGIRVALERREDGVVVLTPIVNPGESFVSELLRIAVESLTDASARRILDALARYVPP